jgi:hypothetical protein
MSTICHQCRQNADARRQEYRQCRKLYCNVRLCVDLNELKLKRVVMC